MKHILTTDDVLSEIEFELVQGAVSKNDLGRGIQEVKMYQSRLRSEMFQPGHDLPQLEEIVGRQYQLNDMLLTLLQETVAATQEVQQQARRLSGWQPKRSTGATTAPGHEVVIDSADLWRDTAPIDEAMTEPLQVEMEVRPTNVPLFGTFLHRLKLEMHGLVLFYLGKVARKQTAVNRTYGDWLLYHDAILKQENTQLRSQLAALEARLAALEADRNDDADLPA